MRKSSSVTISNTRPRTDTTGNIVDCHDGCLQRFGERFYLYGTCYGTTDGFTKANRYRCYSSADLVTWTLEGNLLKNPGEGVHYRPYVVYHAAARRYVCWYNWYETLWEGQYGVAISDTPAGPFEVVERNAKVRHGKPGDLSLFVNHDGTAYLIHTSIAEGHAIAIERLKDDYLGSTLEGSDDLARGCEAPAMFRRADTYYALFDKCCCFCTQGSGAQVHMARSPLGPYKFAGNINRDAADKPIVAAQQTYVARLPGADGPMYVWMGDRWGSRPDGVKGHDFQFWSEPLTFRADGSIEPLRWVDEWEYRSAK